MSYCLHVSSNPLGWIYAELETGRRVLASMLNIDLDRMDVQVNCHGVMLFYDKRTATHLLGRFLPEIQPTTLSHRIQ